MELLELVELVVLVVVFVFVVQDDITVSACVLRGSCKQTRQLGAKY